MEDLKSQIFTGVKWTALCRVYTSLISVLQVAILARILSKEDFGLMGIAVLVNSFCAIFVDMGLAAAAMHETDLTKEKFSSLYWFNILVGFILSIAISSCSPLVARFYGKEELVGIISLMSLIIFVNSVFSLQKTLQQKKMNFGYISAIDIVGATIMIILNIILAVHGYGVYSLVWSALAGAIVTACAYLWIALFKDKCVLLHFDFSEVNKALKIGVFQVGSSTIDFVSSEMDSLIISSCMPLEIFGIYTLFKNLTKRIYDVINPIITNVFTPVLAKMQNNIELVSNTYIKVVETLGFVNFLLYSIVAFTSYSIISLLYGNSYSSYSLVLLCLAFFYAFQSCGNPVGSLLVALGKTDKGFYWTIVRIILYACYMYFASQFSLNVFILLYTLLPILSSFPSWWMLIRGTTTISFVDYFVLPIKPFMISIFFLPLYFLDIFIGNPFWGIIVVSILFICGYYCLNLIIRKRLCMEVIQMIKQVF